MLNHEILTYWWEYFTIIWWGFFPPSGERLLNGREAKNIEQITEEYDTHVEKVLNSSNEIVQEFENFLNNRITDEDERRRTIETKAHSLIGQTSIAISILLAAISLSTAQYQNIPAIQKILVWLFLILILINFATAGLQARNALVLRYGYAYEDILLYFKEGSNKADHLFEKLWIINYNSYLNDYKATFLKCSQWFFKCSFVSTLIVALLLPPFLMISNHQAVKTSDSKYKINTNNYSNKDTVNYQMNDKNQLKNN